MIRISFKHSTTPLLVSPRETSSSLLNVRHLKVRLIFLVNSTFILFFLNHLYIHCLVSLLHSAVPRVLRDHRFRAYWLRLRVEHGWSYTHMTQYFILSLLHISPKVRLTVVTVSIQHLQVILSQSSIGHRLSLLKVLLLLFSKVLPYSLVV